MSDLQIRVYLIAIIGGIVSGIVAYFLSELLMKLVVKHRAGNEITWTKVCGDVIEPKPTKFPWIYIIIGSLLMGFVIFNFKLTVQTAYVFAELVLFMTISVADLKYRIIPNGIVLSIFVVHIVWMFVPYFYGTIPALWDNLLNGTIGMVICFVVFFGGTLITGGKVGMGDVKLAMAIGFMLGWWDTLLAVAISGILMVPIIFIPQGQTMKARLNQLIPFGPPFSLAAMIVLTANFTPLWRYIHH